MSDQLERAVDALPSTGTIVDDDAVPDVAASLNVASSDSFSGVPNMSKCRSSALTASVAEPWHSSVYIITIERSL